MGKGHRDNHAARVKRGPDAFAKKAQRRAPGRPKCAVCGTAVRRLTYGLCAKCAGPPQPVETITIPVRLVRTPVTEAAYAHYRKAIS
jgi:hypothetical protein